MGQKNESGRRAVLKRAQINEICRQLMVAKPSSNRQIEKRVNAAEVKITKGLNPRIIEDGNVVWDDPPEIGEYWFSRDELFGIKTAFVQMIKGSMTRPPINHGTKKYLVYPLLRELGILSVVQKETEKDDESDDYTITLDGEGGEEPGEKRSEREVPQEGDGSVGEPAEASA